MPPLLIALGQILLAGGDLEDALVTTIWTVTKQRHSRVLDQVRGLTMGNLKNLYLVEYRRCVSDPLLLARLAEFEASLDRALELRNEFVHASWRADQSSGKVPVQRKRIPRIRGAKQQIMNVSPEEIMGVALTIGEVANEAWAFLEATLKAVGEPADEEIDFDELDFDEEATKLQRPKPTGG